MHGYLMKTLMKIFNSLAITVMSVTPEKII